MLAFEVKVNGEEVCADDIITAMTIAVDIIHRRGTERIPLHLAGPAPRAYSSVPTLQWLGAHLGDGDEITIRIVEMEREGTDILCSFCGKVHTEIRTLVSGIKGGICNECIESLAPVLERGTPLPIGASLRDQSKEPCLFCGKCPPDVTGLVVRNANGVCPECLRSCADIIRQDNEWEE